MIKKSSIVLMWTLFLVFSACSTPQYVYKAESSGYFNHYKEQMFQGDLFQAQYYLKDAIKSAKHESSLEMLTKIYLGSCAIENALYLDRNCSAYKSISRLVDHESYDLYEAFILGKSKAYAPILSRYENVIEALNEPESNLLGVISTLPDIYAKAIAISVIKRHGKLNLQIIDYMINEAEKESFKGLLLVMLKAKIALLERKHKKSEAKNLESRLRLLSQ